MIGPKAPKPTTAEERAAYEAAMVRDDNRCQKCHRGQPLNRHHRKGRGVGGRTTVEGLQILCGSGVHGCHGYVTQHPAQACAEGWACPGWADPAEWPAARWVSNGPVLELVPVLYHRDGTWSEITATEAALRRLNNFAGVQVRAT